VASSLQRVASSLQRDTVQKQTVNKEQQSKFLLARLM